jgi:pimeloyl-ACP methyl ester carboxylesterase
MNGFRIKNWVMILILASFLAGCGGSPAQGPGAASPTAIPPIELQPCAVNGVQARCGVLSVYENRAAQTGRKIDIHLAVIKARGPDPAPDPIFYVAGGPGASGLNDAPYALRVLKAANARRDIVLFDQRGTGRSNRMACPRDRAESLNLVPFDEAMLQDLRNCVARVDGDPAAYTTAWGVDDLEDIRIGLGYDQINLYGESYGPTAEQIYLQRHGEHVRTMTLEGVSLTDTPMFERMPRNSQGALDLLFARCQADRACNAAYPNLRAEVEALLSQLEEQPVELSLVDPQSGEPLQLTHDWMVLAIHGVLGATPSTVKLPGLIHQAYQGEWSQIEGLVSNDLGGAAPDWSMMNLEILCHEDWARTGRAETERLSQGSYMGYEDVRRFLAPEEVCALMPHPQREALYEPVTTSPVPVLLISNEADPQDPPANVATAKQHYPNSLTLVAPGQSHGYMGIPCRVQILADFIEAGTVEGLDARCLEREGLPAFQ